MARGDVTGCVGSLAAHWRVVWEAEDRTEGIGPRGFNGRNTQTFGLPGLRPVAPSLRSGSARRHSRHEGSARLRGRHHP